MCFGYSDFQWKIKYIDEQQIIIFQIIEGTI